MALLTILPLLGIDIAPLLTSAGVLGVALGFGAQNLVKDYLSGIFIVLEDQFGVGDTIEVASVVKRWRKSPCGSPDCATSRAWSGTCATARSSPSEIAARVGRSRSPTFRWRRTPR